ncbi:MAG: TIR domain-containing protein [bacterium]|nr:TIR domain-containing protein [bacterium]
MSEIFISYAREDKQAAQMLASILKEHGFSIWWDRKIPPGKTFDEVIQGALDRAKCVVVLWSRASIESDFVKDEAQRAANRQILVPVLIEAVRIPLGFGRLQTANLVDWQGDPAHPEFDRLLRSLAATVGRPMPSESSIRMQRPPGIERPPEIHRFAGVEPEEPAPPPDEPRPRKRNTVLWGVALALLAAIAIAGWLLYLKPAAPAPIDPVPEPPAEVAVEEPEPAPMDESAEAALESIEEEPQLEIDVASALAELERMAADPSVLDKDLLGAFRQLGADAGEELDEAQAQEVMATIRSLEASIDDLAELEAMVKQGDLTLLEQIEAWRGFVPTREASPAAERREARLAELDELARGSASIADPDLFVTCRGVREDSNGKAVEPTGVADAFGPGTVHLFAWVRSPRSREALRLEWRDGAGKVVKSNAVTVYRNEQPGYRFHYYRQFGEPGSHEVRLYNEDGVLIGRRQFEINPGKAPSLPAERFVDHGNGTVTDRRTRLTWTRAEISNGEGIRWEEAAEDCRGLDLARRDGWRLPSLAELETLRDSSARVELRGLFQVWSSEQAGSGRAWQLDFKSGERVESRNRKKRGSAVLCVTGG